MNQIYKYNLSIVIVVKNNYAGLLKTIDSITALNSDLIQIVIVDGRSIDGGVEWLMNVKLKNTIVISGYDSGIYDAMNKAKQFIHSDYVLYLNSGDWLSGVFLEIHQASLLRVNIIGEHGVHNDFIKLFGYGYNHQGVIFKSNHGAYDCRYHLAADLNLIISTYRNSLKNLPIIKGLQAHYRLDGVSSQKSFKKNIELCAVFWNCKKYFHALILLFYLPLKDLVPYKIKYQYAKKFKYE